LKTNLNRESCFPDEEYDCRHFDVVEEVGNGSLDEEEAFNQTQREKELEPWLWISN
jgi:hypothetical protein